jgi:Tol biopolymer transport system component
MKRLLAIAGSLPLLACSATLRRPLRATDAASDLAQVTRSRANEFDPAISPDARALAYEVAVTPEASPHVEVLALDGAAPPEAGKVAYSARDVVGLEPAWLPDGTGLLFATTSRGATSLVEVARLGSGHDVSFVNAGRIDLAGLWPAVSPGIATVAVSLGSVWEFETGWRTTRRVDEALGVIGLGTDRNARGGGLVGMGTAVLGRGSEPSWSPDGMRIAFVRVTGGHTHLLVAKADGTSEAQITDGSAEDEEPAWSPDGKHIVFCSAHTTDGTSQANLFVVGEDGSGLVQLTEGDSFACRPAWGRDGFIYFHANPTDGFHIWRLRPTG